MELENQYKNLIEKFKERIIRNELTENDFFPNDPDLVYFVILNKRFPIAQKMVQNIRTDIYMKIYSRFMEEKSYDYDILLFFENNYDSDYPVDELDDLNELNIKNCVKNDDHLTLEKFFAREIDPPKTILKYLKLLGKIGKNVKEHFHL